MVLPELFKSLHEITVIYVNIYIYAKQLLAKTWNFYSATSMLLISLRKMCRDSDELESWKWKTTFCNCSKEGTVTIFSGLIWYFCFQYWTTSIKFWTVHQWQFRSTLKIPNLPTNAAWSSKICRKLLLIACHEVVWCQV